MEMLGYADLSKRIMERYNRTLNVRKKQIHEYITENVLRNADNMCLETHLDIKFGTLEELKKEAEALNLYVSIGERQADCMKGQIDKVTINYLILKPKDTKY